MAILVTGGAGYIGSHMVFTLVDAGEQVVVIDNLSTGFRDAVSEKAIFIEADIADTDRVATIIKDNGITAIIHFAGSIVVPESVENPLKYYDNNTANSRGLIDVCVQTGVKHFIFSSTAAVYGDPEKVPVAEDTPLDPLSPYGTSKLMTEWMLRDTAAAHDFSFVALRYFNVAGADPSGRTGQSTKTATNLIKLACLAATGQREKLSIFGQDYDTPDGTGIRDFIHVSDLAAAHKCALNYLRAGGASEVINCGYGHGYSVMDVIETVRKISGVMFPAENVGRRDADIAVSIADNKKALSLLKWQPDYDDLETIVTHALAWEKHLMQKS